jgi:hypothetical protein
MVGIRGLTNREYAMKKLVSLLAAVVSLAIGITSAEALVLCVSPSGAVTALDQCKPGTTQLNVAATGLTGPVGPQGPAGPAGPQGPAGPSGTTQAYFVKADFGNYVSLIQFIQLPLPAGTYLVTGKVYMTSDAYGGCALVSGAEGYETYYERADYDSGANLFAAVMVDKITLAEPTTVGIRCGNGLGAVTYWQDATLSAIAIAP